MVQQIIPAPAAAPFQREERFIVIKRKHLTPFMEASIRNQLAALDVSTVESVVVESDWPEYETVWGMIERRVTGQPVRPTDLVERIARDQAKADGLNWDEPCGQDADGDICCESSTCMAAFYEDHDADAARRHYLSRAGTALATVQTYMASNGRVQMDMEAGERLWQATATLFTRDTLIDALANQRRAATVVMGNDFQYGVADWMMACFGPEIAADRLERADRFTEEALELAQTMPGFTADRAHALVDYVFGRPIGERHQEVGGVMVTLAALCNSFDLNIAAEAARELARVWTKVEAIREKQASKPVGSPLPGAASLQPDPLNTPIDSLPYQAVFNAIAAATKALTPKAQISISVECFKASLRTALTNSEGKTNG